MRFIGGLSHSGREKFRVSVEASSQPDAAWALEQFAFELSKRDRKRKPYQVTFVYEDLPRVEHRDDGSVWARDFPGEEPVQIG